MNATDLRFELLSRIREHETIFFPLMKANKRLRHLRGMPLVHSGTDIVIEGYFRCANTFAALAFVDAQRKPVILANHTHAPATIDRSVRLGIPTLLLIREPQEMAISHILKHPGLSLKSTLTWYARYYEHTWHHRESIIVADFTKVISDLGSIIERINMRFGTTFDVFEHNDENISRVFARIKATDSQIAPRNPGNLSIPDKAKAKAKEDLRKQLEDAFVATWLARAQRIYQEYYANDII